MKRLVLWRFGLFGLVLLIILTIFVNNNKSKGKKPSPIQKLTQQDNSLPQQLASSRDQILEDIQFPENFFFGTASSDFQTTGGTGNSDWNEYIKTCLSNQKCHKPEEPPFIGPDNGTDFLSRYKEDFDLAKQAGIQVHRLSLEWARIEPEEGKFDKEALKKYRAIISYMKSVGIEPMICGNHFALPLWSAQRGGLEDPQFPYYYSRYMTVIAEEIGRPLKIKWWLTFNEPQVMLIPYTKGVWPPDKPIKSFQDLEGVQRAIKVTSNILDAHRLSYRTIHSILKGRDVMVSYASAPGPFYPHDPDSPLDQMAYTLGTALDTLGFDYAAGKTDRDFLGLNYYGRVKLKSYVSVWGNVLPWLTKERPFAIEWEMPIKRKQGSRPKEFYPRALYDLIMKFRDLGLPVIITENGLSDADDKFREEFMVIHLKAIHDAIRDGVPVIGYQYWALTDTWEWDGRFSNFGLIAIDREHNLERKLRPSALTYRDIIQSHKITKELLEKHKELIP